MTGMSEFIQVMGAMVIFSLILMNMNRFMVLNDLALVQNEYEQVAMAAGQSIINEARVQRFDENDETYTAHNKLGPEGSENRQNVSDPPYNDFDDYHGYYETRNINGVDYNLGVEVCYVEQADLDQCVDYVTEHKYMTVEVDNRYMDSTVRLHMVKSAF